ncbi:MAG: hypothetical protein R3E91_01080 [Chlamydiales bacterium]
MSQVSILCGFPFCQSTQGKETNLSIKIRVIAIALGIIAAIAGILSVFGLGHLGAAAGGAVLSVGTLIALVGASIKCIKTSRSQTIYTH